MPNLDLTAIKHLGTPAHEGDGGSRCRSRDELERLVAAQEAEIRALQDASRRKDEFLAMVSHELRNPLAPLMNGLQLMRKVGTADSGVRSLLAMMDRQLRVLTRLVNDLLDVGRLGSGKMHLDFETVSLRDVVASTCELAREQLETSNHQIVLRLCGSTCAVRADRGRLEQVFINLLTNAAKYSDRGTRIEVTLESTDGWAEVTVRDRGVGIEKAALEEIFNLYSQVRLHQGRAEGGLGIGLALVRRLIELHDGFVRAQSDGPGHGSCFSVRVPLLRASH